MPLKQTLSRHWFRFQRELFPWLEEALGPLGERYQRLVRVLELMRALPGGVAALQPGRAGPAAGGSCGAGAGLSGESGEGSNINQSLGAPSWSFVDIFFRSEAQPLAQRVRLRTRPAG